MNEEKLILLKMDEVAEILNISKQRVYDLVRKNILPGVNIGR
ncbi:MAG: helix-turn-helix domain-containing protein [Bacillota bacterium]